MQSLDTLLARLSRHHTLLLAALNRLRSLREASARVARERLQQLRSTQERLSDLAWELEDIEVRLRELDQHQPGSGDVLLDREVLSLRRRHDAVEEELLAQMLQADELSRARPAGRQTPTNAGKGDQRQERLQQRIALVEERLALARQQRQALAAVLPPEVLEAYEALRPTTANRPLTTAENGKCAACGGILAAADEALTTCPQCGRIVITLR